MNQDSDTTTADPYRSGSCFAGDNDRPCIARRQRVTPAPFAISFGGREVDGMNVQAYLAMALLLIVALVVLLRFHSSPIESSPIEQPKKYTDSQPAINVATGDELIDLLKKKGLWEIGDRAAVPPLILAAFPGNIDGLDIEIKKKAFLHALLPAALVALDEVARERQSLRSILAKIPEGYHDLDLSDDFGSWGRMLSMEEINYVLHLCRKYRTTRADLLVNRVDVIPLSLLLAQAAIESSWGSSRFALEGNNLFGIWTWGDRGIIPNDRDEGKTHKVAAYDSILDSVRAYIVMLNRLPEYKHFRDIRRFSRNPLKLAEGLLKYSERGYVYVVELQSFIENNDLHRYDHCFLARPLAFNNLLKRVGLASTLVPDGNAG